MQSDDPPIENLRPQPEIYPLTQEHQYVSANLVAPTQTTVRKPKVDPTTDITNVRTPCRNITLIINTPVTFDTPPLDTRRPDRNPKGKGWVASVGTRQWWHLRKTNEEHEQSTSRNTFQCDLVEWKDPKSQETSQNYAHSKRSWPTRPRETHKDRLCSPKTLPSSIRKESSNMNQRGFLDVDTALTMSGPTPHDPSLLRGEWSKVIPYLDAYLT